MRRSRGNLPDPSRVDFSQQLTSEDVVSQREDRGFQPRQCIWGHPLQASLAIEVARPKRSLRPRQAGNEGGQRFDRCAFVSAEIQRPPNFWPSRPTSTASCHPDS